MWIHRYTLTPKRALSGIATSGPRVGALIRVGDGFADVHPWPELGDATLDEQLARLARGETTPITAQALEHARIDGAARSRGQSLFDGLEIPASHWPGNDPPPPFDTAKIKGAGDLPPRVRLRIDFNATLQPGEFERIAASLPRERIDFVEDPCPYDGETWNRLRGRTGLRLALDRGEARDGVDVLVVKPAVQAMPVAPLEIVVTSYMDHALGQMTAAWVAAANAQRVSRRCGLFTHVLFESDPFFERIRANGAYLLPPEGTGFGFDDLLESLPWTKLA
jgi:O-succinylbenzoate synthase